MIYQVVTRNRLCQSKKYFTSKSDIRSHLDEVVKKTIKYYSEQEFPQKISKCQIDDGIYILSIDEKILPNWEKLLGPEKSEIFPPFVPITEKFMTKRLDM